MDRKRRHTNLVSGAWNPDVCSTGTLLQSAWRQFISGRDRPLRECVDRCSRQGQRRSFSVRNHTVTSLALGLVQRLIRRFEHVGWIRCLRITVGHANTDGDLYFVGFHALDRLAAARFRSARTTSRPRPALRASADAPGRSIRRSDGPFGLPAPRPSRRIAARCARMD